MWILENLPKEERKNQSSVLWIDLFQNDYFSLQQKVKEINSQNNETTKRKSKKRIKLKKNPLFEKFKYEEEFSYRDNENSVQFRIITIHKYSYKTKTIQLIISIAKELQIIEKYWNYLNEIILQNAQISSLLWIKKSEKIDEKKEEFLEFLVFQISSFAIHEKKAENQTINPSSDSSHQENEEKPFEFLSHRRRARKHSAISATIQSSTEFIDDHNSNLLHPSRSHTNHPIISPRGAKPSPLFDKKTKEKLKFKLYTNTIPAGRPSNLIGHSHSTGSQLTTTSIEPTPSSSSSSSSSSSTSTSKFSLPKLKFPLIFKEERASPRQDENLDKRLFKDHFPYLKDKLIFSLSSSVFITESFSDCFLSNDNNMNNNMNDDKKNNNDDKKKKKNNRAEEEGKSVCGYLYLTEENLCFISSNLSIKFYLRYKLNCIGNIQSHSSLLHFEKVITIDIYDKHKLLFHSLQNSNDIASKINQYKRLFLQQKHENLIKSLKKQTSQIESKRLWFKTTQNINITSVKTKIPLFSIFNSPFSSPSFPPSSIPLSNSSSSPFILQNCINYYQDEGNLVLFGSQYQGVIYINDLIFYFISNKIPLLLSIPFKSISDFEHFLSDNSFHFRIFTDNFNHSIQLKVSEQTGKLLIENWNFNSFYNISERSAILNQKILSKLNLNNNQRNNTKNNQQNNINDGNNHSKLSAYLLLEEKYQFFKRNLYSLPSYSEKYNLYINQFWNHYFNTQGSSYNLLRSNLLLQLVRLGIPNPLRGKVWKYLFGVYQKNRKINNDEVSLSYFIENFQNKTSQVIAEIDRDIDRSLPEHPYYQVKEGTDSLRRILIAFSWRNPVIGYCQSMNLISALLLLFMSEEDAFNFLCLICEDILPLYYTPTMEGALIDQQILRSLMEEHLPKVHAHLLSLDVPIAVITLPWFLCIFIKTIPWEAMLRVLDIFFSEGRKVLFQIALAIFKINEEEILTLTDSIEVIFMLKENVENVVADQILKVAFENFEGITTEQIDDLWRFHSPQIQKELRQNLLLNDIKNITSLSSSMPVPLAALRSTSSTPFMNTSGVSPLSLSNSSTFRSTPSIDIVEELSPPPSPSPDEGEGGIQIVITNDDNNNDENINENGNNNLMEGGEKGEGRAPRRPPPPGYLLTKKKSFQLRQSRQEIRKIVEDIEQKKKMDGTSGLVLLMEEFIVEATKDKENSSN